MAPGDYLELECSASKGAAVLTQQQLDTEILERLERKSSRYFTDHALSQKVEMERDGAQVSVMSIPGEPNTWRIRVSRSRPKPVKTRLQTMWERIVYWAEWAGL